MGAYPTNNPIYVDDAKAREALEALRWPDGPICANGRCRANTMHILKVGGAKHSHRAGLYSCRKCRTQFTVTVGTFFERSRVPLSRWLRAIHMLNTSITKTKSNRNRTVDKKTGKLLGSEYERQRTGPAIAEIERACEVNTKTALMMWQRICRALDQYRGPNRGFGSKITAHIATNRPKPPKVKTAGQMRDWYRWRDKQRAKGFGDPSLAIDTTGLLASYASAPAQNIEATERLLRLLLGTPPASIKPSRGPHK